MKIAVVGNTGSGKTTFARRLAEALAVSHVELDALFWQPGWEPLPTEQFRARVERALRADGWVVDGNYFGRAGRARARAGGPRRMARSSARDRTCAYARRRKPPRGATTT